MDIASFPFSYRCGMRSDRSRPPTCHLPNPPGSLARPWCWAWPGTIDRNGKAHTSFPPHHHHSPGGYSCKKMVTEKHPSYKVVSPVREKNYSRCLSKSSRPDFIRGNPALNGRPGTGSLPGGQIMTSTLTQQGKVDRHRQGAGWVWTDGEFPRGSMGGWGDGGSS